MCMAYHLAWKAFHTKRDKHHFHFWNFSKYKTEREKSEGDTTYYVPCPPCPPPNYAHEYRYLGAAMDTELSDDKDIQTQLQ